MGQPTALLERDEELETIEAVLGAAWAGTGGVVLIEGEAGAGKTSLLDAAATAAAEMGMLVLRARGGAHERDFPYGVMRQLLEPQLSDPARRARALSGAAALAEPVFDPVLSSAADPRHPARPALADRRPRRRLAAGAAGRRRPVGGRVLPAGARLRRPPPR